MKIVYSDKKTGLTGQAEVSSDMVAALLNKRIGDEIDGAIIGLQGYVLKITGGSDKSGFPMENSIQGTAKRQVLKRVALSGRNKGEFRRLTVSGSTISESTEQINTVITKYGDKSISEIIPQKEKKAEEKAEAQK